MTDQLLQYDFSLASEHHFTVLAGVNYTKNTGNIVNIGSQRATSDYIYTINEPSTTVLNGVVTTNVTDFGTTFSESRSASAFGQINYDYDSRYLFSGTLRKMDSPISHLKINTRCFHLHRLDGISAGKNFGMSIL